MKVKSMRAGHKLNVRDSNFIKVVRRNDDDVP